MQGGGGGSKKFHTWSGGGGSQKFHPTWGGGGVKKVFGYRTADLTGPPPPT